MLNIIIHNKINSKGFTLVELSIVLVIIGLLIGGILVGQSLIESTKLQGQIRQYKQYEIAIQQFHQKFNSIPGDSELFSGDGDGFIENSTLFQCFSGAWDEEMPSFFQDLSSSGFGIKFDGSTSIGDGYPETIIDDSLGLIAASAGYSGHEPGAVHLCIVVPEDIADLSNAYFNASITPADALAIDIKLDDGNGQTGMYSAYHSFDECHISGVYQIEGSGGIAGCRPSYAIRP